MKKLQSYEEFMPSPWRYGSYKNLTGYIFENAGIIEVGKICKEITKECEVRENCEAKEIKNFDNYWEVNKIKTKSIILATGVSRVFPIPYINIRPLCGARFDVRTSSKIDFNISKDVAISTSKNGVVKIGATHLRCETCIGRILADETLIDKAQKIIELKDLEILKSYSGMRAASTDYFPILGEIIDSKATLEKYPYIKHGSKVPNEKFIRLENLYIHNGVGSRGFVLSPYSSKLLCDSILNSKKLDNKIENSRLFYKWARKL